MLGKTLKCTEERCGRTSVITDSFSGEIICGNCGLVLSEKSEDRGQDNTGQGYVIKNRTWSALPTVYDRGLPTMIGLRDRDALGNTLSADMRNRFSRLRTWDARSKNTHIDKNLKISFSLLDALKVSLGIPDMVAERAVQIYKKAVSSKLTRGRSITSVLCASLYAACRESDIPRTLNDIATAANISKKILSRSYRTLVMDLDLNPRPYDSSDFINKIASHAMISEKIRRDALEMLAKITKKEIHVGRNPLGIASSVLYLSCIVNGEKKTQETIAKASGITAVTIRNTIPSIRKELGM